MLLSQKEIQESQSLLQSVFPQFAEWKFSNELNDSYDGFCIWGRFQIDHSEYSSTRFFITFDKFTDERQGHLTVGMHNYWWSSTDEEDARLLSTDTCATLDRAIVELKKQIGKVSSAPLGVEMGF